MSTVAFNFDPGFELGPLHEVLVALLLELVHEDVLRDVIAQFVIFNSSKGSDVVSVLVVNIKNYINITIAAPVLLVVAELDCLAGRGDVSRWHFFNEIERLVKTKVHVYTRVSVLGLHVHFHGFGNVLLHFLRDRVLQDICRESTKSNLPSI